MPSLFSAPFPQGRAGQMLELPDKWAAGPDENCNRHFVAAVRVSMYHIPRQIVVRSCRVGCVELPPAPAATLVCRLAVGPLTFSRIAGERPGAEMDVEKCPWRFRTPPSSLSAVASASY